MVNLRSISVYGCEKLDCSRALELLASWEWATQLESLDIGDTNAEGTLDALASCTSLTSVNVSHTYLRGKSLARSVSQLLTCTANR